jgi:hypothetical protein
MNAGECFTIFLGWSTDPFFCLPSADFSLLLGFEQCRLMIADIDSNGVIQQAERNIFR